jgi:hypothetical protein
MPRLDARWVESGRAVAIDMGNERERGERIVIEADKVRNRHGKQLQSYWPVGCTKGKGEAV